MEQFDFSPLPPAKYQLCKFFKYFKRINVLIHPLVISGTLADYISIPKLFQISKEFILNRFVYQPCKGSCLFYGQIKSLMKTETLVLQ